MASDLYLTRSDIAKILKVSLKQAGRLMCDMPVIQISEKQRRVSAEDFEPWCNARRVRSAGIPTLGIRSRRAITARQPLARTGSLIEAARSRSKTKQDSQS